eukprot:1153967-Pelagomonas_calceolata.AAC.2
MPQAEGGLRSGFEGSVCGDSGVDLEEVFVETQVWPQPEGMLLISLTNNESCSNQLVWRWPELPLRCRFLDGMHTDDGGERRQQQQDDSAHGRHAALVCEASH